MNMFIKYYEKINRNKQNKKIMITRYNVNIGVHHEYKNIVKLRNVHICLGNRDLTKHNKEMYCRKT